jgi:hypothetical protein
VLPRLIGRKDARKKKRGAGRFTMLDGGYTAARAPPYVPSPLINGMVGAIGSDFHREFLSH